MDTLRTAANGAGVQNLISSLFDDPVVQGFALGIHNNYVSYFREEFESPMEVNEILIDSRVPSNWSDVCSGAGYAMPLSPVYVLIYVSTSSATFQSRYKIAPVVPPNHAVFVSTVSPFIGLADYANYRPAKGGTSIGSNAKPTLSGTLGGSLRGSDGNFYLLSCNHVLLKTGDQVLQPAAGDQGSLFGDLIGATSYVVDIPAPTGFTYGTQYNKVDAAVALLNTSSIPSTDIRLLKTPKMNTTVPTSGLSLGDKVVFVGKESDYQEAEIWHYIARAKITLDISSRGKVAYNFGDLFEIRPRKKLYVGSLAKHGDSGSLVLRETAGPAYEVCGLLTAGSGKSKRLVLCGFFDKVISELNRAARVEAQKSGHAGRAPVTFTLH